MKNILRKASELGKAIGNSVGDVVDDIKDAADDKFSSETGFLVETFSDSLVLATRLNELQETMKRVEVQAMSQNSNILTVIIKIED